jgi:hypothetical protein
MGKFMVGTLIYNEACGARQSGSVTDPRLYEELNILSLKFKNTNFELFWLEA